MLKSVMLAAAGALFLASTAGADGGNVLTVKTQSGTVICRVQSIRAVGAEKFGSDRVDCQGHFAEQAEPGKDGKLYYPTNSVGTDGNGTLDWFGANMAAHDTYLVMTYGQTLVWGNWTIYPDASGTRFTNTRTGHGMFVSYEDVHAF